MFMMLDFELRAKRVKLNKKIKKYGDISKEVIPDEEIRESVRLFYKFTTNDKAFLSYFKIYDGVCEIFKEYTPFDNSLDEGKNIFNSKILRTDDITLLRIINFYKHNTKYFIIFYSLLIFKGLTVRSVSSKKEKDVKDYVNSDGVLSFIVNSYEKFCIFFNLDGHKDLSKLNRELRSHFFAVLSFLEKIEVIEHTVTLQKNDGILKTIKHWKVKNWEGFFNVEGEFAVYFKEPKLYNIHKRCFFMGGYYSKVTEVFRKNFKSGLSFEYENMDYIKSLKSLKWYVDMDWFKNVLDILEEKEKFTFTSIKNDIEKTLSDLDICFWKDSLLQKKLSSLVYYYRIYKFYYYLKSINFAGFLYFAFFIDFRGRQYIDSMVGVTACKILRTVFFYGFYSSEDLFRDIDIRFLPLVYKYQKNILQIKEHYGIKINSNKLNVNILFVIFSTGKFFIDKTLVSVSHDDFVNFGCMYHLNLINKDLSIEDFIEIESYKNILNTFNSQNLHLNKKRIVIKDFTASFFQHMTRLAGPRSIETIKLANMLDDGHWHDPYSFFIENFKKNYNKIAYPNYFTRSNCKKPIMTIPYSIGEKSAWEYFIESIPINSLSKKELSLLRSDFKLFFNFVKTQLDGDGFFKNKTDRLVLLAITQCLWFKKFSIEVEGGKAHLVYYKHDKKIIDLIIWVRGEKLRITKNISVINEESIDYENIALSVRANWMALLDAETLRKINQKSDTPLYSIHDSVLPDWLSQDCLIVFCNEALSENDFPNITWDNSHDFYVFSFTIIT